MLKTAGLGSPVLGSIAVGVVNLVGSCGAVPLMDRAGRRLLLAISHAGMAVCLLALSVVTALPGESSRFRPGTCPALLDILNALS